MEPVFISTHELFASKKLNETIILTGNMTGAYSSTPGSLRGFHI